MDTPPSFLDRHCDCFDDDIRFFQKAFERKNAKPQVLTRVDDSSMFKLSKKVPPKWQPRESHGPEFFDPIYKAALCYYCYLNESDGESGDLLKIRPMKLSYHLDDETFSLFEPTTKNSGHIQGRQFHRQKVPRNPKMVGTDYVDWKDVHIGQDLTLFGKKYRIVGCDEFTKSFLEDRGIHVDSEEPIPTDAWSVFRHFQPQKVYRDDRLKQIIHKQEVEEDLPSWEGLPQTLIYHAAWLDSKNDFHGTKVKRTFRLLATPADDTVTLIETTPGFNNQLFLKGMRLNYMNKDKINRFYRVANFRPGIWIDVFKRPMYIYDCEGEATKAYVRQQFGTISYGTLHMDILEKGPPAEQFEILPNELMFKASNDEFPGVKFLITYDVNNRKIDIFEESRLKEWAKGRTFLLDIDATSMSLETLKPGSVLRLFKWDFKLNTPNEVTDKFIKFSEHNDRLSSIDLYNDLDE